MKLKNTATIMVASLLLSLGASAQHKAAKKSTKKPAGGLAAAIANGKVVYSKVCITCHMADGGGVPNMNPPLIGTKYVLGDKTQLINIVLKGFKDEIEINDQTFSNTMPAQDYLKDQEIADVLTYIRNNFGNKASQVKVAEVKAQRAKK